MDDDFVPDGFKKWSTRRYRKKLYKLSKTISGIGHRSSQRPPSLIGVAEVENEAVVKDLISFAPLRKTAYDYIHHDSPDERGIDTALIYHKEYFEVLNTEPITLLLYTPAGERDTTRDILYVYGKLNGEEVHVFVNHWPSKRQGGIETDHKRIKAAETINDFMAKIEVKHKNPNYIVMGDFNDDPSSESIQKLM